MIGAFKAIETHDARWRKKRSRDQINDPLDCVKLASDETSTEIFRIPRKMSICEK